jgi:uncharacterized protein (DUF433 family)
MKGLSEMNAPWSSSLGVGFYTVPQAARLLRIPPVNIRRWLGGYTYRKAGRRHAMPPLWEPQLPPNGHRIELGFRDLIELRFVQQFLEAGLGLLTIRNCLVHARAYVNDDRPFSTRRFRTDGRTIFLESAKRAGEAEVLDLKNRQYELKQLIERSFKDLDLEADAVARWRPLRGKQSIVIDPARAFGQPIAARSGVPTRTLADAAQVEESLDKVAELYEVSPGALRDAIAFETSLAAA